MKQTDLTRWRYWAPQSIWIVVVVAALGGGTGFLQAFTKGRHRDAPGEQLPDFDRIRERPPAAKPVPPGRAAALEKLRRLPSNIRVDLDPVRRTPRQVRAGRGFLTGPNGEGITVPAGPGLRAPFGDRPRSVVAFLEEHTGLFGQGAALLDGAVESRRMTAPRTGLRTVVWEQQLDGIRVYGGVLIGHETARSELVSISSLMIPWAGQAADRGTPNRRQAQVTPAIDGGQAVRIAAEQVGELVLPGDVLAVGAGGAGPDLAQAFKVSKLPGHASVRLTWLPVDEDALRLCWQIEITRRAGGERYRVLIDASTGEALARRRLTVYVRDATYRVFTGDSPMPFSPGWSAPRPDQPSAVERSWVTLSALSPNASPLGWIADADNETRGNNVDAHTDLDADDQPDLPRPVGVPFRVFDPPLDLQAPPAASSNAAVVQLFYWCNWAHDQLYDLGFVESAGNFQKDNLGRGGLGGDAMAADALDGSGVNNANFTPSSDGEPGRIQMFVWADANPDRDGDFDAEVILHEYVHGLSTRLVGGGVGINTLQAAGLGEGWSDFYAMCLLSDPADDVDGVYPFGAYVSYQLGGLAENYYFGIRRYPYCTDKSRQPLTLRDIDPLQASPHEDVPCNPLYPFNPLLAPEVHAQGEVWCAALWDARANLIRRDGASAGNRLILQLVTDGMKLSPPDPTFLEARDAILLADQVDNGGANQLELWRAFAGRGMGFGARVPAGNDTIGVAESYEIPDALSIGLATGLFASGPVGGPFAEDCVTFLLTNHSSRNLRWEIRPSAAWLRAAPESGMLAPGVAERVTVCVASNATAFPVGVYDATLAFVNLDSGVSQERLAELRVMVFRALPFEDGFESGELEPHWSISGTSLHRSRVTSLNGPASGVYHLTMDTEPGVRSRNEVTLGLDLAGYTNVQLRFWARTFGDEPNPPAPGGFIGGADFDGVAISEDGVRWYEAMSLRDLPAEYQERIVDLDAAISAHGLHFTSGFRIRFNQFDDFNIPFDGIGVDDVRVTGIPARRFFVELPARAIEGAGPLAEPGFVRLGAPTLQDLTVLLISSRPERVQVPASVRIPAGTGQASFLVTILENTTLDGTERILVSASADGYAAGAGEIDVADNEVATLRVTLPPKAREGDGVLRRSGSVQVSPRPVRDVTIDLESSLPAKVQVPSKVLLRAGAREAEFDLTVLDDIRIDGPRNVSVTARVNNWRAGSAEMRVADNDAPELSFALPAEVSEISGRVPGAAIRLSGALTTNLTVLLASSDSSEIRVPASVVVPAGMVLVPLVLDVADDPDVDGPQTVTVSAKAPGFAAGTGIIEVLDDETPSVPYRPEPADGATNVPVAVRLAWGADAGDLIVNGGFETGDLTGWSQLSVGFGRWLVNDGELDPEGPDEPAEPLSGLHDAVTVQNGAGYNLLYQEIFIPAGVPSATLSWTDRIHNHATHFASPEQEYRVDIQDANAAVLATAFQTQPADPNFIEATRRTFDLSAFRGQSIRVAFAEQDGLGYINVALDDVSVQLGGHREATTYDVYVGTSPRLRESDLRGTTTNTFWTLSSLGLNVTHYWQLVARRGAGFVRSPLWRFTTRGVGDLERFALGPLPPVQQAGQRFTVTATAQDDLGNTVTSFAGPARLTGVKGRGNRSRMLITEIDVGPVDRVELGNSSDVPVDVSGWTVSFYDSISGPAPLAVVRLPAGTVCPSGEVFVVDDGMELPGAYPVFHAGTNVSWSAFPLGNAVAVLVRDEAGEVADFAVAGDAQPPAMTESQLLAAEWSGPPIDVGPISSSAFTLQRVGRADADSAGDWEVAGGTMGTPNPRLSLPFARRDVVPVIPDVLENFSGGKWTGYVTVQTPVDQMILEVLDETGHRGVTLPFAVAAANDLSVAVADSPDVVILGEPLRYLVTVTNPGPARVGGIVVTNWLPSEVRFIEATGTGGTCSAMGSIVVCQLNDILPGDSARITLLTESIRIGVVTNRVALGLASGIVDGYDANNRAVAWSTITGPSIVTTNVTVNEGSSGASAARFPVWLSAPCRYPVSVAYETTNVTARAGLDFVAASGTLTFPPGETRMFVTVPLIPDRIDELREQFVLVLSSPTNGVILTPLARARIEDDDPVPLLRVEDAWVVEGPLGAFTNAAIRFVLSAPSETGVRVNYATAPAGSAEVPADYQPVTGTLTFPDGATNQTVNVPVRGDSRFEPEERFTLNLSLAVGMGLVRTQALVTIVDDDSTEFDRLEWSEVPSPGFAGYPFGARLTARDGLGRLATGYSGPVAFSATAEGRDVPVGGGTNAWRVPFGAFYHDLRAQVLYLPEELGAAGRLNALTFDLQLAPGQTLSNWTVRVQQTTRRDLGAAGWETNGWTTVHHGDLHVADPGPVTLLFNAPFDYNGVDGLLVDFSFDNATYSTDGLIQSTSTSSARTLYLQTDSAYGSPLTWAGMSPPPVATAQIPNVIARFERPLRILPDAPAALSGGVWMGAITIRDPGSNVVLRADDGHGRPFVGNRFDVLPGTDANNDGVPEAWELWQFGSIGSTEGRAQADADGDGLSNRDEFLAGTDPTDSENTVRVMSLERDEAMLAVRFLTRVGRWYRVETRNADGGQPWASSGEAILGTGGDVSVRMPLVPVAGGQFLRIRVGL